MGEHKGQRYRCPVGGRIEKKNGLDQRLSVRKSRKSKLARGTERAEEAQGSRRRMRKQGRLWETEAAEAKGA